MKSKETYKRVGQHDYKDPDYTDEISEMTWTSPDGVKLFYTGQTKGWIRQADGIGLMVWAHGDTLVCIDNNCIYEGYWKNGKRNGHGRYIASQKILDLVN